MTLKKGRGAWEICPCFLSGWNYCLSIVILSSVQHTAANWSEPFLKSWWFRFCNCYRNTDCMISLGLKTTANLRLTQQPTTKTFLGLWFHCSSGRHVGLVWRLSRCLHPLHRRNRLLDVYKANSKINQIRKKIFPVFDFARLNLCTTISTKM